MYCRNKSSLRYMLIDALEMPEQRPQTTANTVIFIVSQDTYYTVNNDVIIFILIKNDSSQL